MTFTHGISAVMERDSISPDGVRLSSLLVTYNRFIIAEFDTHRVFSRNSASSRAIPFETMLQRSIECPAPFVEYPREQRGMQGGPELEGADLEDALRLLEAIQGDTIARLQDYIERHPDKSTRLHKSLLNRTLEWFGWTTTIVSSTEWANFFRQRAHKDAQPEFRELAYLMREVLDVSQPNEVDWYEWHTPFASTNDNLLTRLGALRVSTARCARTSLLSHDGEFSHDADFKLYDETLAKHGHWSPLEHPAVCIPPGERKHFGNFDEPWHQFRHFIEHNNGAATEIEAFLERTAA